MISGAAWAVATFQSAGGDHDSTASIANYAASGLAILAGAAAFGGAFTSTNSPRKRRKSAGVTIAGGVLALGSGIAWAVGTDTSQDGGVSNMIGAGLSIAIGVGAIAYGIGSMRKASRGNARLGRNSLSATAGRGLRRAARGRFGNGMRRLRKRMRRKR